MFRSLIRTGSQASSSVVTMSSITKRGNERLLFATAGSHSTDKILVLGGNSYVGSHICKEALRQGLSVSSLSRSGRSSLHDSWVDDVTWHQGTVLRPGFIHGTRQVGSIKLPLSLIGAPLEMVLKLLPKEVTKLPLIGPLLIPPVNVKSVAGTAVKAAVDPEFASGVMDVYRILQHGH